MELGQFALSLTVKDLGKARAFYEQLGFRVVDGKDEQRWLILKNGETVIGLFEGMFKRNMLTFRPADVRAVQRELKATGLILDSEADEEGTGTAAITLTDPDGNPILMDQPMTDEEREAWEKEHYGQ